MATAPVDAVRRAGVGTIGLHVLPLPVVGSTVHVMANAAGRAWKQFFNDRATSSFSNALDKLFEAYG
jgi:hypothetical protein